MPPTRRRERSALVSIAIHDVAPATWPECRALLALVDALGVGPLTLLVVPDFHHRQAILSAPDFVAALTARLARGDELSLHGYFHQDEAPPPRTLRGFVERRVLTRTEGEFAALGDADAAARLVRGIEMFHALDWPLHGFVPPAWLMSRATRRAVSRCGHPFSYVSLRGGLHRLPDWSFERTANLCYSPDRGWRRLGSRLLIRRELVRARHTPLLRLSLHPQDARVSVVMRHWARLIESAVSERTPVTKYQWAAQL